MSVREESWGRALAALRQWAAETPGVTIAPEALTVAKGQREAFYAQVDEVADLLAAEVLGERLAEAARLAEAVCEVRGDLLTSSGLGAYRLPERLEHFVFDPHRAVAESLATLVVDAVSGRVSLAEAQGLARETAGRSLDVLARCAYEAWAYLGIVAAMRPVRFWAVASRDGRELSCVPTDEVRMGWQVPSRELRHPEAVFETADGDVLAVKCEAAREIDYYNALAPVARDTSAGGSTEDLLGHRVLLLYRLGSLEAARPLVDRKAKVQLPADLACTVLAPGEMANPSYLGSLIARLKILRTRRPVRVLTFDGRGAFPAEMAADSEVPAVETTVARLSRTALEGIAANLGSE